MKKLSCLLAASVAVLGMTFAASPVMAAPKAIKVAHTSYPGTPVYRAWLDAKAYLDKNSNGKYVLDVNDSCKLGPTSTTFQGAQFGTIHIVEDGSANFSAFDPAIGILDLPYLFPDYESVDAILNGAIGQKILDHLSKKGGVHAIHFLGNGFRGLFTNSKVEHTAQMKGMKMRTTPSKVHVAGIKALGMSPTPMAWSETVTGVQQRVINGFDIDLVSARTMGLGEIAPFILMSQHMYTPHLAVCSADWWDGLNAQDKELFQKTFDLLRDKSIEYARTDDKEAVDVLKTKGHTLSPIDPAEKAAWIKAAADVYKEVPQIPAEWVEEIHAQLKKMGKI